MASEHHVLQSQSSATLTIALHDPCVVPSVMGNYHGACSAQIWADQQGPCSPIWSWQYWPVSKPHTRVVHRISSTMGVSYHHLLHLFITSIRASIVRQSITCIQIQYMWWANRSMHIQEFLELELAVPVWRIAPLFRATGTYYAHMGFTYPPVSEWRSLPQLPVGLCLGLFINIHPY